MPPEVALLLKQFFLVVLALLPIIIALALTPIYPDRTAVSIPVPLRLSAFILLCIGAQIQMDAAGGILR